MVKKKAARQKHQRDAPGVGDTSEEELKEAKFEGKVCQHVTRALNFARVKKSLKVSNSALCVGCTDKVDAGNDYCPDVFLCLQCGYRGCGRTSQYQHAIQHNKTIHSDCHALVLSSLSGLVWCFECDDAVNLQQSRNLRQSVEFLKKNFGNKDITSNVSKTSSTAQCSSLNTVTKEKLTVDSKGADSKSVNKNKKETVTSKSCVKGLRNLGNTCFFNAVMQNLNQTCLLFQVLERACAPDYVWEVPRLTLIDDAVHENVSNELLEIAIPRQFLLANSLLNVYKLMNALPTIKNDIVNPSPLFTEISKKCPQFKHFQQQDSHELLRQLLDGLRQDEVKRQKKAILRHFDIANVPIEDVAEETKKLVKAYSCYASHTIVEKIFGGLFISTVLCEECKTSSQVFEPFMDVSLPLFEEKQQDNCNQPFLDGGQQKDFKPLRNRKGSVEHDENNEYILTKAKSDDGKPSKHQMRKLRDLAKKEKKKKNIRTKKISETIEDSVHEEEDLSKENNTELDKDAEHITAEEQESDNENAVKANAEGFADEDINTTEKVETENCNLACTDSHHNLNNELGKSEAEPLGNGLVNNNINDIQENIGENNSFKEVEIGKVNDVLDAEHLLKDEERNYVSETLTNHLLLQNVNVIQKLDSEPQSLTNGSAKDGPFHNILDDLLVDEIPEQSIAEDLAIMAIEDAIISDEHLPEEFRVRQFHFSSQNSNFGISVTEEDFTTDKKPVTVISEIPSPEQSIEKLAENFEKLNVSNGMLESDERMQALGLQVKEVRIRKDSDRQGSILDSSLSPDDETVLASCESQEDTCDNENDEKWSHNVSKNQIKEWILKSLFTLKPRKHILPSECSIDSCLSYFTKPELLTGSNKFRCEKCTELKISKTGNKKDVAYSNASKQLLLFSPPAILTLHLKRFQQVGMSLRKVNRFVEFPSILDLAPYCSSACLILPHMSSVEDEILYSLYGVVEHSGGMSSGHYIAYVKTAKRTLNQNFMCHLPLAQCDLEQLLQKFSNVSSEKSIISEEPYSSDDRRWYYISDTHVREVDEAQVMKCQAYLLFYERIK